MTRSSERLKWLHRPSVGATGELKSLRVIEIGHPWIDRLLKWSSWLVLAFVVVVVFLLPLPEEERSKWNKQAIDAILVFYFLYILLLETGSRAFTGAYDLLPVRLFRMCVNLTVVSTLIYNSAGAESYFWCLYAVPLFQANMYLRRWKVIAVYILTFALYWVVSSSFFALSTTPRAFGLLLTNTVTLISMALLLYWLFGAARAHRRVEDQVRESLNKNIAHLTLLDSVSSKMTYARNLVENLKTILEEALKAVSADSGSIMIVDPKTGELDISALMVDKEWRNSRSRKDGIAAYVAETCKPVNCRDTKNDPRYVESEDRLIRSILSVPIITNEKLRCIINADSPEPNHFKDDDIILFYSLGEHVSTMVESLRLREVVLKLSSLPLDQLYTEVVDSAFTLVRGDIATLSVDQPDGSIQRVATYPRELGNDLEPPRKDCLTSEILQSGKPKIINDVPNDSRVRPDLKALGIVSLIGVPLLVTVADNEQKAIGSLFVFSKSQWKFGPDEIQILDSLARQAASAIIQRRLNDEVTSERDFQQRLLGSAFDAIIAVNRRGIVTEFNPGAEKILGYSKDEAINTEVTKYYRNDSDALEVGRLLRDKKNNGRLINHYTYVRAKNDDIIPIRLSASMLDDEASVGFFRDLSEIEDMREHLQLLPGLPTDDSTYDVDDVKKLLETSTKGAMETLQVDAAWIYYFDHEKKAFQLPPTKYPLEAPADVEERLLPLARRLLDSNDVFLVEMANQTTSASGSQKEGNGFECFAGVPLTVKNKTLGVVILGYVRADSFDNNRQYLIRHYIGDIAIKLDQAVERSQVTALLDGLYKTSLGLPSAVSLDAALQSIVEFAAEATGAKFGAVGIVSPTDRIHPFVHTGVKADLKGRPTAKGLLGRLFREDEVINESNIEGHPDFESYVISGHPKITSFLGAPISLDNKGIGNIYVSNKDGAPKFSNRDQRVLRILGNFAAGAVKSFNERKYATAKEAITIATVLLSQFPHLAEEERKKMVQVLKAEGLTKPVQLDHILREIAQKRNAETGIRIPVEATQACLVRGNEFMLERASSILIDNAIHAVQRTGRKDGNIKITCEAIDGLVRGTITDNGIGVPEEHRSDLFVKRLVGRKDRNDSSFLAGWILRAHEGDILLTETSSSGTTVDFWLPEANN